jgi:hypothetical protein
MIGVGDCARTHSQPNANASVTMTNLSERGRIIFRGW